MSLTITSFIILLGGVSLLCFNQVEADDTIYFLLQQSDAASDGLPIKMNSPKASSIVRASTKVCVEGMWAMYTEPDYGRSNTANVTVYPAVGSGPSSCTTTPVGNILRRIQSVRKLSAAPDMPMAFYPEKYFISKADPITESHELMAATASMVKSLTVHKSSHANKIFRLCPEAKAAGMYAGCVCIDTDKTANVLIPDLNTFPTAANPLKMLNNIASFPACTGTECKDCEMYESTLRSENEIILTEGYASS